MIRFLICFVELYSLPLSTCPLEYCWGAGRVNSSFVQMPAQVVALCAGSSPLCDQWLALKRRG